MDPARIICSETWLDLKTLPEHVAMIGSGYIGVEMGQFYRRMGSQVTLIERGQRILAHEDPEISEAVEGFFKREGIKFLKNVSLERIEWEPDGARLIMKDGELRTSHVFVCTGREGATEGLGLETLGLKANAHGFIPCNDKLETAVAGVWLCGDVRGGPLFTHTSWDDYRILESQLLGDKSRTLDRIVPYAIFSDPELGRVGLSETDARQINPSVSVARFPFSENGKAYETRETDGFIKLVADSEKGTLLGAAVLGPSGSELVQIYTTLMKAKAPLSVIDNGIYIHPTLAEAVQSAVTMFRPQGWRKKAA
jgi:pyruvate/2-oxoglutarate dehydrogenase complex dihydrolipoamide dehydrogenase (E3) component